MNKKIDKQIRAEIYYEAWIKYSKIVYMQELADIFRIPLATFYKIVKGEEKGREKLKKGQKK
jgi:predicted transcriptional regulator